MVVAADLWESDRVEERKHQRTLLFTALPTPTTTPSACCSVCKRRFELTPKPGEHADDVILRMREEFEGHNCNEPSKKQL
ncbi:MAG: hypothetical protein WCC95_10435 [Candidatus Sulfotelmatobacter sp.]